MSAVDVDWDNAGGDKVNKSNFETNFTIEDKLGEGGFGTVFKAKHKVEKDALYAVKKIELENIKSIKRAKDEVNALKVCKHKNVVKYETAWIEKNCQTNSQQNLKIESGNESGCINLNTEENLDEMINLNIKSKDEQVSHLYIQMELCKYDLREYMQNNDVSHFTRLRIFREVLRGVDYIHKKGFIHRDLKPRNIFLGLDGNWKIGDFGLVALHVIQNLDDVKGNNLHTRGIGTPLYMAPEQKYRRDYDKKVDIYPLGLIFYELIAGFTSHERVKAFKSLDKGIFIKDLDQKYPIECATILKMVSTEPKERPTVAGIRKMLERKFKAVDLQLKKRKRNQKTTSEPTKKSKKNQKKV